MRTKLFLALLLITITSFAQITTFDFETAADWGNIVSQSKDGYTVYVQSDTNLEHTTIGSYYGFLGAPGGGNRCFNSFGTTGITYSFNQPVDVVSIVMAPRAASALTSHVRFTFTPTGGTNSVKQLVVWGEINAGTAVPDTATLNWSNITSFRITAEVWVNPNGANATYLADDLKIMPNNTLSTNDIVLKETFIAPNPCFDKLNVSSRFDIQNIKLFNTLGKLVLETNKTELNVEKLKAGLYVLKITTKAGTIQKKIIKQ